MQEHDMHYAGFWIRFAATIIDTVLVMLVTFPVLWAIYGPRYFDGSMSGVFAGPADIMISWVMPSLAVILFWRHRQATPGKMMLSLQVVDADSGAPLTLAQGIGRYFAYFASTIPMGLGFLWVAFDKRKQGWHDKLAHTVVIRARRGAAEDQSS
jgi:uncharacterized RDD family membrane protein YckC